jgi:O-antigen/teichoic acid export membrane protein
MSFLRQFIVYGLGGVATRLAAVVLVPLYTRTLSVVDYGRLEVLLAVHALLLLLAGMQLESSVARDFYEARRRGDSGQLAWITVWLTAAGAAAVSLLITGAWARGWLPVALEPATLLLLLLLTFPAQIFGVQLVILRFAGRPVSYAVLSFCDLTTAAACSAWFIVGLHWGIAGALAGMLVGKLACMLLAWPLTIGRFARISSQGALVRRMLDYGVPSMPAVLISWLQNAGSRLLLAVALTLSDVAVAGIAIKVAALYSFIVYSFRLAWEPFSIAKLEALDQDPRVYHRTLEWYVVSMFLVFGVATLVSPQIVQLLAPPAYARAGRIAVLFLMGQFWVGMTNILVIGVHGARRTGLLLPVYGYGALVNVVVLFALAPVIGVAAAGVGFLAGSMLSALLARHYSNKYFNTGFTGRLLLWTALASIGFVIAWYTLVMNLSADHASASWALLVAGCVLLAVTLVVIGAKAFDPGRGQAMWSDAVQMLCRRLAAR